MSLSRLDSSTDCQLINASGEASMKGEDEPPSRKRPSVFLLGQDSRGHWVAQNRSGTRGGLFVNRDQALRYIRFEGGDTAFVTLTSVLELNLARPPQAQPDFNLSHFRLVA